MPASVQANIIMKTIVEIWKKTVKTIKPAEDDGAVNIQYNSKPKNTKKCVPKYFLGYDNRHPKTLQVS